MGISLLIILWILLFIVSSIAADNLIEYQYEHYREAWKFDGSPRGMFFNPKSSSYFPYAWPMDIVNRLALKGAQPAWIEDTDETALKLWKKVKLTEKIVKYYLLAFFPLLILVKCTEI
jgi:hypothetical protein